MHGTQRGTGTDRARLRRLDICLTFLEEAHERDELVVSQEVSARVRPFVPAVAPGMPIAQALDRVFLAQHDCQPAPAPVTSRRGEDPLSRAEARALTEEILVSSGSRASLALLAAQERRAWLALGHPSWERYVRAELGLSRTRSYELLDHARLVRAIEAATGVPGAADIPPYAARRVKPYVDEVIARVQRRTAGRPAEEIPAIVRDVVGSALTGSGPAVGYRPPS